MRACHRLGPPGRVRGVCLQSPYSVYCDGRMGLTCPGQWELCGLRCSVGEPPWLADTPYPTVFHGAPPVSLTSAWQEVVLDRKSRWENNHQAGPPGHSPLHCHRCNSAATPLHSATAFLDTLSGTEKHSCCSASWAVSGSLRGSPRAPSLE